MNCETAKNQLIDLVYVEGAADPLLVQHVESCSDCRQELAELSQAKSLLECFDDDPIESLKEESPFPSVATKRTSQSSFLKRLAVQLLAVGCAAIIGAIGGGAIVARMVSQSVADTKSREEVSDLQQQLVEVSRQLKSIQTANEQGDNDQNESAPQIAQQQTKLAALAAELSAIKRRQKEAELSLAILRDDMKFFGSYVAKYTGR